MGENNVQSAVLLSIRPKWVDLIRSGKKTVELRKNYPRKVETPFKCFIYECGVGIVGEFTCDWIEAIHVYEDGVVQNWMWAETDKSGLTYQEVAEYVGLGKDGFVWRISNLRMYKDPRKLTWLPKAGARSMEDMDEELCHYCLRTERGEYKSVGYPGGVHYCEGAFCTEAYDLYLEEEGFALKRPPQSWCYVEEPG